jgi:serine/threonine protein phosphatase PrpC
MSDICDMKYSNFITQIAGASNIGRANEDKCAKYTFTINGVYFTLLLVLDGHGCRFSKEIVNNVVIMTAMYFPVIVYEYLSNNGITTTNAEDAIVYAHHKLQKHFNQFSDLGLIGSCTGGALIFNNTCVVFNLGDIVVLHLDSNGNHRELSVAHNSKNPDEYNRLIEKGVNITQDGRIHYVKGGILVSRALGDNNIPFLEKTPHIFTIVLQQDDQIIVVSDGVIDGKTLTIQRVIDIVKNPKNPFNIAGEIIEETLNYLYSLKIYFGIDDSSALHYSHSRVIDESTNIEEEDI